MSNSSLQQQQQQQHKLVCAQIALNIVKETCDLKLLVQNRNFLLLTLSQFFFSIGFFLPFIYIPLRADELGITEYSWILSVIGIVNIPGRLVFGFLADRRYLSSINLNTIATGIIAIIVLIYFSFTSFGTQIFFAIIFAIGMAGIVCVENTLLIDIVGKQKFSNAIGIINLFRGVGCFIGPPIGGVLSEKYNTLAAFFFAGGCMVAAFVFTAVIGLTPFVQFIRRLQNGNNNNNNNNINTKNIK